MYAVSRSLIQNGFDVRRVDVECHLSSGLPSFKISGLPSTAIKESRERVRAAIKNSGFEFPRRRITVNLAPANLPKYGTHLDLAIAISILKASKQIRIDFATDFYVLGELNLQGRLSSSAQCLNLVLGCMQQNSLSKFIIPSDLSSQISEIDISAIVLKQLVCIKRIKHFNHNHKLSDQRIEPKLKDSDLFSDILNQYSALRALQISLAGHHHLLLVGPPGCGKSLIADKLRNLPKLLDENESWQSKRLFSMSSQLNKASDKELPVRCPHHSASTKGIIGGGRPIIPGEVSLSHRGYLILDELPEFKREVLESLRQVMQSHSVNLSHGFEKATLPAVTTILANMNPCPCGYYNSNFAGSVCRCLPQQVHNYQSRISGPLLDRFNMSICMEVDDSIKNQPAVSNLKDYWSAVFRARSVQKLRYKKNLKSSTAFTTYFNGQVAENDFQKITGLRPGRFSKPYNLMISNRKHSQLLRIAQTIADLNDSHVIQEHFDEALYLQQYTQNDVRSSRRGIK
tara:strand:- start:11121 stop:12662 length:1542 start_codon:yes stop_codon:yes gene_type:complete